MIKKSEDLPKITICPLSFHPLSPFGWEVRNLDITQLDNDAVDALKIKLAHDGVVIIRDQFIDDSEFVAFLRQLGTLTFTTGEKPVEGEPMLNVVTNVGRKTPPRSVFHTDTSYVAEPPNYTALRAIALPQRGGETLFCNQYRAYDRLPNWVKTQLADAKLLHVVSGLTLTNGDEQQTWHPLFRRHPISGRVALFMSTPERCLEISGLGPDISQRVIRLLYRHSIERSGIYRHHWRTGDIVVWDNRCILHQADHSQVVGDRTLHRGLIAGEAPIPA